MKQFNKNEKIALPAIEGEATALIASYDTLADFQNQFTNVDGIVEKIQQYEDSLAQKTRRFMDKILCHSNY